MAGCGRQSMSRCDRRRLIPVRGRGRCGRERRRSYPDEGPRRLSAGLDHIRHTARSAALIRTTRTRRRKSTRGIAAAAFRLRSAAAWRTRPQPASADDSQRCGGTAASGTNNERRCCARPAADPRVRRCESNGAILRREFVPRDPCRTNQLRRCLPRWQTSELRTTRGGCDRARAA